MGDNTLSLFGKTGVMLTSALSLGMLVGGLIYAEATSSLLSRFASLIVSYIGGWTFMNMIEPASKIISEVARTSWKVILTLLKTFMNAL